MMPIHCCTWCDGLGGSRDHEDGMAVWFSCEGCGGSGETTSCRECGDPMPRPEAEEHGYHCPLCLDAEDRAARQEALQRRFA